MKWQIILLNYPKTPEVLKYSMLSVTVMAAITHLSKELPPISVVSVNVKIHSWTQVCYTQQFPLKWTKFCFPFSLKMCVLSDVCSSGTWVQTYRMVLWTSLLPTWFVLSDHRTAPCISHGLTESTRRTRPLLQQSQLPLVCALWIIMILLSVAGACACHFVQPTAEGDFLWNNKCKIVPEEVIYRDLPWLVV